MSSNKQAATPTGSGIGRTVSEGTNSASYGIEAGKKKDLLEMLEEKQSDLYRYIQFKVPINHTPFSKNNYQKRISFDTVNIQYDDSEGQEMRSYENERAPVDSSRGRGRIRTPSPADASPGNSPSRLLSPMKKNEMSRILSPYRKMYPTRPIVKNDGCIYTKMHNKFHQLNQGNLDNKENNWLVPVLPRRCILIFISGRRHTWVALDWILSRYIENGDSIVIVTALDSEKLIRKKAFNQGVPSRNAAKTPTMRLRQRNRAEAITHISRDIMSYAMEIVNPEKIVKITVEISLGKTKQVLKDMCKLYEPNIISTGAKLNTRRSAPLRSWNSSRITDRLVKLFPLPVILVPSMMMSEFEHSLENEINSRYIRAEIDGRKPLVRQPSLAERLEELTSQNNSSANDQEGDSSDSESFNSEASISSSSSSESYSSFEEVSRIYTTYKGDIDSNLSVLRKNPYNENYFSDIVKFISDRSSEFCQEITQVDPDFKGRAAKLAREITGSNRFGTSPYKTKSMLGPQEEKKPAKTPRPPSHSSMSYKDIKRTVNNKSPTTSPPRSPPTISIDDAKDIPKSTSLKFVDAQKPLKKSNPPLKKFLSHDIDASSTRPKLEVSKSQPDITSRDQKSTKEGKKNKRKSFWRIFT